jgi:signal transduction histidine kinase
MGVEDEVRVGFEAARLTLARLDVKGEAARKLAAERATVISARALSVERVGVWLFSPERDQLVNCHQYTLSSDTHGTEVGLDCAQCPAYVAAILERRCVVADDALADPRTRELAEGYLLPNGITSMLDAPIFREGEVIGVVCHEHVGPPRRWTTREADFASSVADMAATILEQADRISLQARLAEHAKDELEREKSEALARLARGIAHDINNALSGLSLIGMSLERSSDVRLAQQGASIAESVRLLGALARRLTAFGMPRNGGQADLAQLVERMQPMLEALFEAPTRLEVTRLLARAPIPVDATEACQVVLNLVVNARDASPPGGVVQVAVRRPHADEPFEAGQVVLEVRDDGDGIDDETQRHMFEPYFTRKPTGTGLGLAIVQQVVSQAGGRIVVESALGRGTRVKVGFRST